MIQKTLPPERQFPRYVIHGAGKARPHRVEVIYRLAGYELGFQWRDKKNRENLRKHGISPKAYRRAQAAKGA